MTSGSRSKGRFVKQDFRYVSDEDVYVCPADECMTYRYTNVEKGLTLPPLLDPFLPRLRHQGPMHHGQGTSDYTLGSLSSGELMNLTMPLRG